MANLINLAIGIIGGCALYFFTPLNVLGVWGGAISFLLSYPWTFGDNIYSLWGGKNPRGSVYSLCPVYIDAIDNAIGIAGIGYLKGGHDAVQFVGIAYLKGGHDAVQFVGIAYLNGGNDAMQVVGIAYLKGGHYAVQFVGIAYLNGGNDVGQIVGIAYLNGGNDAVQFVGIAYLNGGNDAVQVVGISAQLARKGEAVLGFGIPLYQKGATFTGVSWEKACH
ncbi:MAG: hypothetical protein HGA67_03600 [Candidatus Yonathbacteria bacterium]|nr:hypothetical protein [Candidatus Yonathbacteria bacterium]